MSDNPFAEPGDDERTVIRPIPGGRRPAAPPPDDIGPAMPMTPEADQAAPTFEELSAFGVSPIVAAASPLLSLLGRLRNIVTPPSPAELREHAVGGLRRFEATLRARNTPIEQLRFAHYILCASLDDVVLSTPWGSVGAWASASLVSTFHHEVQSGERFFDVLAQLRQHPGKLIEILKIAYLCMSLGMQGRYRVSSRGPAELDRLREEVYALIMRHMGAAERSLSPHWVGVSAPYRPIRARLPIWVAGLAGLGLVGLVYAFVSLELNGESDRVFEAEQALRPVAMPAIAHPVATSAPAPPPTHHELDHLAGFFAPEIRQGLVTVAGTEADPVIRIRGEGMFASGSASIERSFLPLLTRIGVVLQGEQGRIHVIGYTDNQPIHTIRFPSNFQLSSARAAAAAHVITAVLADPGRVSAEGKSDADPIADNSNEAGRKRNRRIEVVLHRPPDARTP